MRATVAGQVLDLEFEAASRAESGDRGWIERQGEGTRDANSFGRTAATILEACCDAGRWSHGFRIANSTAEFDCAALVRKLSPLIEPTISTPASFLRVSRICAATASVRSSEAPSGPCMTTKK